MRALPELWPGAARIQYACAFLESLQIGTLKYLPLLAGGFRSVEQTALFQDHQQELLNLRLMGLDYPSDSAIRRNASKFMEAVTNPQGKIDVVYEISLRDLSFRRRPGLISTSPQQALTILRQPLMHRRRSTSFADQGKPLLIPVPRQAGAHISANTPPLPERTRYQHDPGRIPRERIAVSMRRLRAMARLMDREDRKHPEREPGRWERRLRRAMLCRAEAGLPRTDRLDISDVVHLIGLPSSGKTTLLIVLGVYLGLQRTKTLMLFAKIETALMYLEALKNYGVSCALLVGQTKETRERHSRRISEAVAAEVGGGGFGATRPGAEYFGIDCPLRAFVTAPEQADELPYGYAPCTKVHQSHRQRKGRYEHLLCPGWYSCGRNKAPRDLIDADVWLGHIISTTSLVPDHAIDAEMRYLELIAGSFDLIIVDEVDSALRMLDAWSLSNVTISGDADSFQRGLIEHGELRVAVAGAQGMHGDIDLNEKSQQFNMQIARLYYQLDRLPEDVRNRQANKMLTTQRLLSLILRQHPDFRELSSGEAVHRFRHRLGILNEFWVRVNAHALLDGEDVRESLEQARPLSEHKLADIPQLPGLSEHESKALYELLTKRVLLSLKHARDALNQQMSVAEAFLQYVFANVNPVPSEAHALGRLLVAVTHMILSYKAIRPIMREAAAQGVIPDSMASTQPPNEVLRLSPANIVGALSGVRYEIKSKPTGPATLRVKVSQLAFEGAPRLLLHRLNNLFASENPLRPRPSVLLTSATSFMKAAPSAHVGIGPHYVLKPRDLNANDEGSRTTTHGSAETLFHFIPAKLHGEPVFFSGARADERGRIENLKRLLDHILVDGEDGYLLQTMNTFDVCPNKRKAGIVVNSYAQAATLKNYINLRWPEFGGRTMAVVDELPADADHSDWITPSQVESRFGASPQHDILIFPLGAIGRGTNIVFGQGARPLVGAIGQLYFLTRPHPSDDDTSLLVSLAGQRSEAFDQKQFAHGAKIEDIYEAWLSARSEAYDSVSVLLNNPVRFSELGILREPFVANIMIDIIQTIGRAMRGGAACRVFFVDAAWAPRSAENKVDTSESSMLLLMRDILHQAINDPDPSHAALARELYEPFYQPLCNVVGVNE